MARRDELLELLRPPAHRGPLIAAGAVILTVGLALEELRLDEQLPDAVHVLILALAAALLLGIGLQAPLEDGSPPAYQSVLLVCGLLILAAMLLELANLLGANFDERPPAGALTWTSALLGLAALYPALRRNSAICLMIAALAGGIGVLAAANWLLRLDSLTAYRWLLLVLAVAYALLSLLLRGPSPRHAELMVVTAGLASLAIVLSSAVGTVFGALGPFAEASSARFLPGFWEFIVLAAGCGLIAYGAIDRVHGAAWIGLANLAGFMFAASTGAEETLLGWPLALLAGGGVVIAAGLRPRVPLPPEPAGYAVERPLASRADEEVIFRVRNDDPPEPRPSPPPGGRRAR
jgi:hypothetical protein